MQHNTLHNRIALVERSIELLHHRLHSLSPSNTADALYARTHLSVLKRSLKLLRSEYGRIRKTVTMEKTLPKRRRHIIPRTPKLTPTRSAPIHQAR